jgi:hypothetical protein
MRTPVVAFLLTAAVGLPAAAREASLTGEWQIQRIAAGNEGQQECSFIQKDSALTGSCSTDRGTEKISAGKVDGKSVTWTCKGDSGGGTATLVYKGTLDSADSPTKIRGKVTAVEYSVEGEFTATRLK